jgi:hypothetical protein
MILALEQWKRIARIGYAASTDPEDPTWLALLMPVPAES